MHVFDEDMIDTSELPSFRTAALTIICTAHVQLLLDWHIEISCECVIST